MAPFFFLWSRLGCEAKTKAGRGRGARESGPGGGWSARGFVQVTEFKARVSILACSFLHQQQQEGGGSTSSNGGYPRARSSFPRATADPLRTHCGTSAGKCSLMSSTSSDEKMTAADGSEGGAAKASAIDETLAARYAETLRRHSRLNRGNEPSLSSRVLLLGFLGLLFYYAFQSKMQLRAWKASLSEVEWNKEYAELVDR